jgi:hypothetical protein
MCSRMLLDSFLGRDLQLAPSAAEEPSVRTVDRFLRVHVAALVLSRLEGRIATPFLPYWEPLECVTGSKRVRQFLRIGARVASFVAFLPGGARLGAGMLGGVMCLSLALNRASFSTASVAYAVALLHGALYNGATRSWPLRLHLAWVYGGPAWNKLMLEDWRTGRAFAFFAGPLSDMPLYKAACHRWPENVVNRAGAWGIMLWEFAIAILYLRLRTAPLAAILALLFHVGCVASTRGGVAWIYLQFAVGPAALFLGNSSGRETGGWISHGCRTGL